MAQIGKIIYSVFLVLIAACFLFFVWQNSSVIDVIILSSVWSLPLWGVCLAFFLFGFIFAVLWLSGGIITTNYRLLREKHASRKAARALQKSMDASLKTSSKSDTNNN